MSKSPEKCIRKSSKKVSNRKIDAPLSNDLFEKIRKNLHLSTLPDRMPCREAEFEDIYHFVKDKVLHKKGGCMYISGVPGTGKTATVLQVIKKLVTEFSEKKEAETASRSREWINSTQTKFTFIEVNGMKMTNPEQVYIQIYKQLTGQRITSEHACNLLNQSFTSKKSSYSKAIVLLVDELDLLWTKKQTVMYNLFDWPSNSQSGLIVIAIANTMDLPERVMMARVASRLGLTRLTFQPYTHQQLAEIITSRIGDGEFFEEEAIEFVARKVAALSGDARRALDICRRATEIVGETGNVVISRGSSQHGKVVTMATVDAAIQEMFLAPKNICVRNSSQQEKLFLHAILSEFHRTGVEEAVLKNVYKHHTSLARLENLPPPTLSQVLRISSKLNSCRLLITDSGKKDLNQKIRLNIASQDLLFALKQ